MTEFIATAVVTLTLTGASWWLMEELNALRTWKNRKPYDYHHYSSASDVKSYVKAYRSSSPKDNVSVRLAMLIWLVMRGHWSWMIHSGAGWCVLTNSKVGFQSSPPDRSPNLEGLSACDYLLLFTTTSSEVWPFWIPCGGWKGLPSGVASVANSI